MVWFSPATCDHYARGSTVGVRTVLTINGAFRPQRVSGQQRYAIEIARELLAMPLVREIGLPPRIGGSTAATWAWIQLGLPVVTRDAVLLSLTSRAPAVARRHIVTVHDLFPLNHPEWYSHKYLLLHGPLLRHHLDHAALVVAVSEPVADQIRELTPRAVDIVVAPNAPSSVFTVEPAAGLMERVLRRVNRADVLTRSGYLLVVGSMDPRKNLDRLVRAHATLPAAVRAEHPLVVVGGRWGLFRGGGVDESADVVPVGYVSDAELASLYRHATAVVLPSLDEGFGLPAVEAAVAGARLIVSDIPVFRWVCGSDARYFDPTDVEAITHAIAQVLTADRCGDRDRVAEIAVRVRERFSWSRSARGILRAATTRYGDT